MKIVKSEQNYIVELGEEEWYQLTPEARDTLIEGFRTDAAGQNCRDITVFANPDPILPIYGIDRRTRVHSEKLASDKLYEVTLMYSAELAPAAWDDLDDRERQVVLREIRDNFAKRGHRNPGRYEVFITRAANEKGKEDFRQYVERGRV